MRLNDFIFSQKFLTDLVTLSPESFKNKDIKKDHKVFYSIDKNILL